jgi:hypothetical protein
MRDEKPKHLTLDEVRSLAEVARDRQEHERSERLMQVVERVYRELITGNFSIVDGKIRVRFLTCRHYSFEDRLRIRELLAEQHGLKDINEDLIFFVYQFLFRLPDEKAKNETGEAFDEAFERNYRQARQDTFAGWLTDHRKFR